jgi:hypothetical protein
MKRKIVVLLSAIVVITAGTGCKKWLDVNTNPNIVKDANLNLLLPSAEVGIATVIGGNEFQVNGNFWSQYWTQNPNTSQFKQYDQFQTSTDDYNSSWSYFYAYVLQDLNQITKKAISKKENSYLAIAKFLTAYSYQNITDAWGDVPFSEALKGGLPDRNLSPKYDSQESIYDAIIKMVKDADSLSYEFAPTAPGNDDLIYQGDMDKWRTFGNTLKLKIALRLSQVNPSKSQDLISELNAASFISSTIDEASIYYTTDGGNQNPYFSFTQGIGKVQNVFGSATCMGQMENRLDPRIAVFYNPSDLGTFKGITQGAYDDNSAAFLKSVSNPSAFVGADPSDDNSAFAPVKFISASESHFLQAEAIARGWLSGDEAASYRSGIQESMNYSRVATTDADYYIDSVAANAYPLAGSLNDKIKAIIEQKYFSMCGIQGFEAWTEFRRTGYPDFFVIPKYSVLGSEFPARFLYPSNELTLNANYPGTKSITTKVWWDK